MRRTLAFVLLTLPLALVACSGSGGSSEGAEGSAGGASTASAGDLGGDSGLRAALKGTESPARGAAITTVAPLPFPGTRIVQTASLRLKVAKGRLEAVVNDARTLAGSLGGFVVSSNEIREPGQSLTSGTLVLRVPSERYTDAMLRLGRLGEVAGREESGQDVSAQFVDLEARRRNLEAVETQLLKLLRRAGTVTAALAVQSRLDDVQLALEQVRGRLRYLDDQTSFATITLSLEERKAAAATDDDGGILHAWGEGAHAFAHVAGRTFVFLATVAPVVLLLALALLAWRVVARRRPLPRLRGQGS